MTNDFRARIIRPFDEFACYCSQVLLVALCDRRVVEAPEAKIRLAHNRVRSAAIPKLINPPVSRPPITRSNKPLIRPEIITRGTVVVAAAAVAVAVAAAAVARRKDPPYRKIRFANRLPKLCNSTLP